MMDRGTGEKSNNCERRTRLTVLGAVLTGEAFSVAELRDIFKLQLGTNGCQTRTSLFGAVR
jgi:hypothetical protein